MNAFPFPLKLRALAPEELKVQESDRQLYQLLEEFRYVSPVFGEIIVPACFTTDFASIPRPVWNLLDPEDPVILFASVVHDYLYTRRGDLGLGSRVTYNRQQADQVLREAMNACGANAFQSSAVYYAVRLGGGGHWA